MGPMEGPTKCEAIFFLVLVAVFGWLAIDGLIWLFSNVVHVHVSVTWGKP